MDARGYMGCVPDRPVGSGVARTICLILAARAVVLYVVLHEDNRVLG